MFFRSTFGKAWIQAGMQEDQDPSYLTIRMRLAIESYLCHQVIPGSFEVLPLKLYQIDRTIVAVRLKDAINTPLKGLDSGGDEAIRPRQGESSGQHSERFRAHSKEFVDRLVGFHEGSVVYTAVLGESSCAMAVVPKIW